jgi:hypothetical protein
MDDNIDINHVTETETGGEAADAALAPECGNCGSRSDWQWESLVDESGEERWLSICGCGQMAAFLPDQPDIQPEDPLRAYLLGLARPVVSESPPWVRLFLRTVQQPAPVRWRYFWEGCPLCKTSIRLEMHASPRPNVVATCTLCLCCGYATASHTLPGRPTQSTTRGSAWDPACPAVKRLRDSALRPYMALTIDGWRYPGDWSDWLAS